MEACNLLTYGTVDARNAIELVQGHGLNKSDLLKLGSRVTTVSSSLRRTIGSYEQISRVPQLVNQPTPDSNIYPFPLTLDFAAVVYSKYSATATVLYLFIHPVVAALDHNDKDVSCARLLSPSLGACDGALERERRRMATHYPSPPNRSNCECTGWEGGNKRLELRARCPSSSKVTPPSKNRAHVAHLALAIISSSAANDSSRIVPLTAVQSCTCFHLNVHEVYGKYTPSASPDSSHRGPQPRDSTRRQRRVSRGPRSIDAARSAPLGTADGAVRRSLALALSSSSLAWIWGSLARIQAALVTSAKTLRSLRESGGWGSFLVATGELLTNDNGEQTFHLTGLFYRTIRVVENGTKVVYVCDGRPPGMNRAVLKERGGRRKEAVEGGEEAKEVGTADDISRFTRRKVKLLGRHYLEPIKGVCAASTGASRRLSNISERNKPSEAPSDPESEDDDEKSAHDDENSDGGNLREDVPATSDSDLPPTSDGAADVDNSDDDDTPSSKGKGRAKATASDSKSKAKASKKSKPSGKKADEAKGSKKGKGKGKGKAGITIPEEWPWEEAKMFEKPDVIAADKVELEWKAPDVDGLVQFLVKDKGFNEDRVRKGAEKLAKFMNTKQQGRLDGFFTVKPKPKEPAGSAGKGKGKFKVDDKKSGAAKGKTGGVKRKASFERF
ncbi:Elongation of fatty acids protein 2 [Pleurotus pulmonarius]|nr:Elongation of fatty acids protein 2 [Pleurotus pulmonarius]